ncbi:MAG: hypothetical protein JSR57_02210 [Verrucomicrobia bacterium]|nr:hypothetical protein [Verrucomicrobiota bacterium]
MAFIARLFGSNAAEQTTPPVDTNTAGNTTGTGATNPAVETPANTTPVATPTAVDTAAVVNTVVDPILQSKLQLTGKGQTKVDALYETTVTNVSNVVYKFFNWMCFQFGKLSSTSAYGTAHGQDVAIKAAAKDFNDATEGLIRAAYHKSLSDVEARQLGIPTSKITADNVVLISHEQNRALALNSDYDVAVRKFNTAFAAALVAGDANPSIEKTQNFMRGAIAALSDEKTATKFARNGSEIVINQEKVNDGLFSTKTLTQIELPEQKLNMAISSFVNSVYHNEIKRFANQDVANITLDSIAAEVEHLKALFPGNSEQKIIKDLCAALMANPLIAQAANGLIDADAIQAAVDARRAGLNAERQEILTRLAQLYKADDAANNPIFQGGTFTFEGQISQAWNSWHGYEAEGRASATPGKVIININGTDTEVDGKVGTDAWGHNIGGHVWVSGAEQTALTKLLAFFAERNGVAATGSFDLNSVESLSALLGFDPSAVAPRLAQLHAEAMNAVAAHVQAKQRFEQLDAERQTKEARIAVLDRENDEHAIRAEVSGANGARAAFLNIFVPAHRHGLNAAAGQLTGELQRRARALAAATV